jgi:hypothetical protein
VATLSSCTTLCTSYEHVSICAGAAGSIHYNDSSTAGDACLSRAMFGVTSCRTCGRVYGCRPGYRSHVIGGVDGDGPTSVETYSTSQNCSNAVNIFFWLTVDATWQLQMPMWHCNKLLIYVRKPHVKTNDMHDYLYVTIVGFKAI